MPPTQEELESIGFAKTMALMGALRDCLEKFESVLSANEVTVGVLHFAVLTCCSNELSREVALKHFNKFFQFIENEYYIEDNEVKKR